MGRAKRIIMWLKKLFRRRKNVATDNIMPEIPPFQPLYQALAVKTEQGTVYEHEVQNWESCQPNTPLAPLLESLVSQFGATYKKEDNLERLVLSSPAIPHTSACHDVPSFTRLEKIEEEEQEEEEVGEPVEILSFHHRRKTTKCPRHIQVKHMLEAIEEEEEEERKKVIMKYL